MKKETAKSETFEDWLVDYVGGKCTFHVDLLNLLDENGEDSDGSFPEDAMELLAGGIPIYYADLEYPGEIVKEYPDGRREIVDFDEDLEAMVVRKLPPKLH